MAWYRRPGVLAGAALAVVLLAALAVPALTGSGEPESGLRIDQAEETDTDTSSDEEPAAFPPGGGMARTTFPRVAWPFERSELLVFLADDVDADERDALVADLSTAEAGGRMRLLDPDQVADRVGETQAARLRSRGVGGAVLIDVRGGERARQAAAHILPTHTPERFEPNESPERPYHDPRIAGTILPGCRELARAAALVGPERAQALLDDAHCDDELRVVAAGPRAEEPWVVTARALPAPKPSPGPQAHDPPGPDAPETDEIPCVRVFTVRVASERCADRQGEAFDGLVGTGWDRSPPVLAGMAPEGADRVTAAGDTLALVDGRGDAAEGAPVFAGSLQPRGEAVQLRALDGQGRVLADRVVSPRELFSADRLVATPGPHPLRRPEPAFHVQSPSWPFDDLDEAVILMDGADQALVEATRAELERDDAVIGIERLGPEQLTQMVGKTGLAELPEPGDAAHPGVGLRATTTSHDEARSLAAVAQRHEVFTVYAPTCETLPATALASGVDRANGLLADAGCDDVTVLDAGHEPPRLAVALATDEHACTFARVGGYGRDRACRPRLDDNPLQVRTTSPSDRRPSEDTSSGLRLAHGLAPAAADTVELRSGEQTVSVEPVPVADGLGAFTAVVDAGGTVEATARDAAGGVLAEADSRPPDGELAPHLGEEQP